jgi:hypothetical protein
MPVVSAVRKIGTNYFAPDLHRCPVFFERLYYEEATILRQLTIAKNRLRILNTIATL